MRAALLVRHKPSTVPTRMTKPKGWRRDNGCDYAGSPRTSLVGHATPLKSKAVSPPTALRKRPARNESDPKALRAVRHVR